ncbi:MAG TPA: HAMP domain-containing sensor histidine kinase [Candidatus Nitrosocosmicus sp.]
MPGVPKDVIEKTVVMYGTENTTKIILEFLSRANKSLDIYADHTWPSVSMEIDVFKRAMQDIKKRGAKSRYIVEITKDNIQYCKELMKIDDLRHLDGIKGNFAINETEYIASATMQQSQLLQQVIYSNVKAVLEQHQYLFETLWNKATPAEQKIKEIEEGIDYGNTEVIKIPIRTKELFINLVKNAEKEILLLLPTTNAFLREERIGLISSLNDTSKERSVNVRILTPINDIITKILQDLKIDDKKNFSVEPFEFTSGETNVNTVSILVIDRKESLVIEKKDDSKMDILDAIGLATYSTSKPTVVSYINIFENLSKQVNLYNQLKIHGKMQEEFINIASHELRTPTQAILTYSDLLQHHPEKRDEMIQAIKRNATRLQRLTEDILDATKIESKTLHLHKEKFDLTDLLSITINDYKNNIKKNDDGKGKIRLLYTNINKEPLFVEADYQRIVQTLSNILNNAVKFAKEGKGGGEGGGGNVYITTEKKKTGDGQEVTVRIKDTGSGIDNDIISRLFTKFATKSTNGTGLGLFICKGVIEAHGGTIWAENNKDGKGSTFAFSLPINN